MQSEPAGDDDVVRVLRSAASRALASGAYTTSIEYLRRTLTEPPADAERAEVLLALGLAERQAGLPDAVGHLESSWREGADRSARALTGLELGRTLFFVNRPAEAIDVLTEVSGGLGDDDSDLRERLVAETAGVARWITRFSPLARELLAAVDELRLHGGGGSAQLLAMLAVDEAIRCGSRERVAAPRAAGAHHGPDGRRGGDRLLPRGQRPLHGGGGRGGLPGLRAGGAGGAPARRSVPGGEHPRLPGYVRLRLGLLRDAEADLREGLDWSRDRNRSHGFQWHAGTLAELLIERGDIEEASALVESVRLDDAQPADGMQLFFLRAARGRLRLLAGEPERALADFTTIIDISVGGDAYSPAWLPVRSYAAHALHLLGRDPEAVALAEEEIGLARAWGAPVAIAVSLRTLARSAVARRVSRGSRRQPSCSSRRSRGSSTRARSSRWRGAAPRQPPDRGARAAPRRSRPRTSPGGACAGREANEELAATGARPRKVLQTGVETLTASERRVAQLAAQEMTNKDIAQALFVTVKTVEVHLSSVYRKLSLSSRRQLASALADEPSDAPALR